MAELDSGLPRPALWPMPVFAAVVLCVLTVSWYADPETAGDLLDTWPLQLTRVLSLPVGMVVSSVLVRFGQRRFS